MSCLPIGTRVRWSSQAGGSTTTKEGVVVYSRDKAHETYPSALHTADYPLGLAIKHFPEHRYMFDGHTWLNRKGVLVEVRDGKTSRAKPKLYMPNPGSLEVIE